MSIHQSGPAGLALALIDGSAPNPLWVQPRQRRRQKRFNRGDFRAIRRHGLGTRRRVAYEPRSHL